MPPAVVVTIAARARVTGARRMAAKCAAVASRCVATDLTHERVLHACGCNAALTRSHCLTLQATYTRSSQLVLAAPLMWPLARTRAGVVLLSRVPEDALERRWPQEGVQGGECRVWCRQWGNTCKGFSRRHDSQTAHSSICTCKEAHCCRISRCRFFYSGWWIG
jgi:hypothetical protein